VGGVINWDSRDNTFATTSGSFQQLSALFYGNALGGDYSFTDLLFDSRSFFEVAPRHVIAIQAIAEIIDGTAPFQTLSKFGGPNLVRGYYDGQYRDKDGIALQAEYRFPVWWRFGLVGFAGIAQVSPTVANMALNRFWFAGGIGVRIELNTEDRINLRIDFGLGNNSSGTYITVTEAF
jgi:outer membrane protein assembly factor BamA